MDSQVYNRLSVIVMKTNWQTQIYIIIIGTILVVGCFGFPAILAQLNLLVLSVTFTVLLWYAYDTHRIANQTIESALRPVILRSGWIRSWDDVKYSIKDTELKGEPVRFTILKNIVKDISGYIIINKKKYKLHFANDVTKKDPNTLISDLESKILLALYEQYKETGRNELKKITEIYKEFGIVDGTYIGILNNSNYIEVRGESILLKDAGIRLVDSDKPTSFTYLEKWGWMKPDTSLSAIYIDSEYEETSESNSIYLIYKDIEGNSYFTKENENFSQITGKL